MNQLVTAVDAKLVSESLNAVKKLESSRHRRFDRAQMKALPSSDREA